MKTVTFMFGRLFIVCAPFMSACSARLYPGAERDESQISRIILHNTVPGLSLEGVRIDNQSLGFMTEIAEVLPGTHMIDVPLRAQSQEICDDWSSRQCPSTTLTGACRGKLDTLPGRTYRIVLKTSGAFLEADVERTASIETEDRDEESVATSLECTRQDRRENR